MALYLYNRIQQIQVKLNNLKKVTISIDFTLQNHYTLNRSNDIVIFQVYM